MGESSWSASLHVRGQENDTPVILIWNGLNKTKSGSYKDILLLLLLVVSSLKSTPPLLTVLIMLTSSNELVQLSQNRARTHRSPCKQDLLVCPRLGRCPTISAK